MAVLLQDDTDVLLPALRRLEVEIRFHPRRAHHRPAEETCRATVWQHLASVCEKREVSLVMVEPLWMWYDRI